MYGNLELVAEPLWMVAKGIEEEHDGPSTGHMMYQLPQKLRKYFTKDWEANCSYRETIIDWEYKAVNAVEEWFEMLDQFGDV